MPRKIGERTVGGLCNLIGSLIDIFQSHDCANDLISCGHNQK